MARVHDDLVEQEPCVRLAQLRLSPVQLLAQQHAHAAIAGLFAAGRGAAISLAVILKAFSGSRARMCGAIAMRLRSGRPDRSNGSNKVDMRVPSLKISDSVLGAKARLAEGEALFGHHVAQVLAATHIFHAGRVGLHGALPCFLCHAPVLPELKIGILVAVKVLAVAV